MKSKFYFLHVDIQFDVPKCKFSLKNNSLKCQLCVVAHTKIVFRYDLVVPLKLRMCFLNDFYLRFLIIMAKIFANFESVYQLHGFFELLHQFNLILKNLKKAGQPNTQQPPYVPCHCLLQKQPPEVFYKKGARCRPQDHRFTKRRPKHRCFPVQFAKFSKTSIVKNIWERLLLHLCSFKKLLEKSLREKEFCI